MNNPAEFELPDFVMHGARSVVKLAKNPEFFERQVYALEEAVAKQPALAFDIAKAMVETTCKTVLNDRKATVDDGWEMPKLVKETLNCLTFVPEGMLKSEEVEASLRKTAGNLQGVVQGICEVRNKEGFASHGRDGYSSTLDIVHAEFIARSADAVVSFLYKSHYRKQTEHRRPEYQDRPEFNEWLDEQNGPVFIFYGSEESEERVMLEYEASEVIFNLEPSAYQDALTEFNNLTSRIAEPTTE